MKTKIWFKVFVVIVIILLISFLIGFNLTKFKTNDNSNQSGVTATNSSNSENKNSDKNSDSANNSTYVESFTINCDKNITIPINTPLTFYKNFVSVSPSTAYDLLKFDVFGKYSSVKSNIEINGLTVIVKAEGIYKLSVSATKKSGAKIEDGITIIGVSNYDDRFKFKLNSATVGDRYSFEDFAFVSGYDNVDFALDSKLKYENNVFEVLDEGVSHIKATCKTQYYYLVINGELEIDPLPQYYIETEQDVFSTQVFSSLVITYSILNIYGPTADQRVELTYNSSEFILTGNNMGLIVLYPLKAGNTTITLTSVWDSSITKTITIIVT